MKPYNPNNPQQNEIPAPKNENESKPESEARRKAKKILSIASVVIVIALLGFLTWFFCDRSLLFDNTKVNQCFQILRYDRILLANRELPSV